MGGTTSSPDDSTTSPRLAREIRMLLGNFDRLDPMTQRLVGLGKKCLTTNFLDLQQNNFKRLEKFNAEAAGGCGGQGQEAAAVGSAQGCSSSGSAGFPRTSRTDQHDFQQVDFESSDHKGMPSSDDDIMHNGARGFTATGMETIDVDDDSDLFYPLSQARPVYLGQTYPIWKSMYQFQNLFEMCVPTRRLIYIQPIDEFPDFMMDYRITIRSLSLDIFSFLQGFTQIFFSGLDVTLLPNLSMNLMGWQDLVKSRHHSVTGQKQYRAKDFYPLLQTVLPSDGHCILGLIWTDLYPEDDLNFILGETSFQHRTGMFCFGRYETKGFDKATHRDITEVDGFLIWKLIRAISHEMCHLFGLRHCTYFHCSMNESTSMAEAMNQPLFLCPVCLRKLHQVCHFDVLDRYKQMLEFLSNLQASLPSVQCDTAISWLRNCISFLQQPMAPTDGGSSN